MSEIQNIRLNIIEVKLADSDDPIALKVSWDPAKSGGSNFQSQKMVVSVEKVLIEKTNGAILFALVFAVPGMIGVLVGAPYFFIDGKIGVGIFMIVWGILFGGVGILMLVSDKKITFDKLAGYYFRGKLYDTAKSKEREQQGLLQDIYALQLISERISSSSNNGSSSSYTSYEINLVFKDGGRANVMDHGKAEHVMDSAKQLGKFLDVPIWKAEY